MSTARKPVALHRLALGTALLAAAAPLAATAPAEASTTANGCVVRPLKPTQAPSVAGTKQVRYDVVLSCAAGRAIEVQQMLYEDDVPPDPDDFTGTVIQTRSFASATVATRGTTRPLPNTEPGPEEVYQRARFRVSIAGGAFSAWTALESGPTLTLAN